MPIELVSETTRRLRHMAKDHLKAKPEEHERAAGFLAILLDPGNPKAVEPDTPTYQHGALALAFEHRIVAYQLRKAAIRLVAGTQLHSPPDAPPRLLQGPWLIEAAHPNDGERLFGDTYALGGYFSPQRQASVLLGWHATSDGQLSSGGVIWNQRFLPATEETLRERRMIWRESGWVATTDDPEDIQRAEKQTWLDRAINFAMAFGFLMDAGNAPIHIREEHSQLPKIRPAGRKVARPGDAWLIRHVYLDDQRPRSRDEGAAQKNLDKEGKELSEVTVKGHLKRQRIGPGRGKLKWVWVESYDSHRWTSTNPVKVVVSATSGRSNE